MASGSDKKWFGNERIQELLAGPFYGLGLTTARAVEIDYHLRRGGLFSIRYFSKYVVCSGPNILNQLNKLLTPEEAKGRVYEGQTLADCLSMIFHGEGLTLPPGYDDAAEERRAFNGETSGPSGAGDAPDEAAEP